MAAKASLNYLEGQRPILARLGELVTVLVRHWFSLSVSLPSCKVRPSTLFLLVFGGIVASTSPASTLIGEVVRVTDGDTLTLLDSGRVQHKIRLAGIDAPEKRQAFGDKSKQQLADLVFRKEVSIEWSKSDRYGRIIGKVLLGNKDINLTQISSGMAWHYKKYANEQSLTDRGLYAQAEEQARANRRGLWRDPAPTAPWDFRHHRYP